MTLSKIEQANPYPAYDDVISIVNGSPIPLSVDQLIDMLGEEYEASEVKRALTYAIYRRDINWREDRRLEKACGESPRKSTQEVRRIDD